MRQLGTGSRRRAKSRRKAEGGEVHMADETGYCVKCKAKKIIANAKKVTMKNKRQALKGSCPDCGTGMYRILGKS